LITEGGNNDGAACRARRLCATPERAPGNGDAPSIGSLARGRSQTRNAGGNEVPGGGTPPETVKPTELRPVAVPSSRNFGDQVGRDLKVLEAPQRFGLWR